MKIAPKSAFSFAAALLAACLFTAILAALRPPLLGLALQPADDPAGALVQSVAATSPNRDAIAPGTVLTALRDATGEAVALDAVLLIEEPDQLPSWAAYDDFMVRQGRIAQALETGTVAAETREATVLELATRARRLGDLPPLFWYQLGVGSLGFLLAAGVWAFRPRDRAAVQFALAGLGLLVFSTAAAVYSTRELALPEPLFRALSLANYFGALFFTASLFALLWYYPRRLGRFPLALAAYLVAAGFFLADVLRLAPDLATRYIGTLGLFAPTFLLAFIQWRNTRRQPVERAALKWFLLSIYLGTGLFAAVILLPSALGISPPASQGLMFVVFLFMFAGIALGITRYRLFDLERWWFGAWSWFLGGLAVIAVDLLLVSLPNMSHAGALGIALALVGWLYFPVRQWAWDRLHPRAAGRQERLGRRVEGLFAAADEEELRRVWRQALRQEFQPLEVRENAGAPGEPQLADDGQRLRLADPGGQGGLELAHPARGSRLFDRGDLRAARLLLEMGKRALGALREREQGVVEERRRIMRDLHDDVGAKLLSLIYLSGNPEQEQLARSAVQDMREVLTALEAEPATLAEAAAAWRSEAEQRAEAAGLRLEWDDSETAREVRLSARQRTNLARILREALTNVLKHADARALRVELASANDRLTLRIVHDGGGDPAHWTPGRGTRVIRTRAEDLGGRADWQATADGVALTVSVPAARGELFARQPAPEPV